MNNVTVDSSSSTNGIAVDRRLVNALLEKASNDPTKLVRWNGTEAITAVLQSYLKHPAVIAVMRDASKIPYCVGSDKDTFSYRNVKVRAHLEEYGTIANLGWFINEAIAVMLEIPHTPKFVRVAKVSEWTQLLSLGTKTVRIATPPVDDGDDSAFNEQS